MLNDLFDSFDDLSPPEKTLLTFLGISGILLALLVAAL